MTNYKNANDTMRVRAYEENGKYYIVISKKVKFFAATRSGKKAIEETTNTIKKEFDTAEHANNYFKAVKKNNPTLARV